MANTAYTLFLAPSGGGGVCAFASNADVSITNAQDFRGPSGRLNGRQSSTLLLGNTSYILYLAPLGEAKAGFLLPMFWHDAKTRISVVPGGKKVETNWWIEGDFVCGEQRVTNRGHTCTSSYQVDSSYYVCIQPAGDCIYLMRVVPGNPDGI